MKLRWIGPIAATALLSLTGAPVGADAPIVPGVSVVGLGNFPGAPELEVETSGGNDVVQVAAGSFPSAYGGGALNLVNGCLDGVGFADLGSGDYSHPTKKHEYVFRFAAGVSVTSFSLMVFDWGDSMPYGGNPDDRYEIAMRAYDAGGTEIDSDVKGFTTEDTTTTHRESVEYGDLHTTGDACLASDGQPGRCPLSVAAAGIVRVTVAFRDRTSMDPHVALGRLQYAVTPPPPPAEGVRGFGFWKTHADWPADTISVGGVSRTQSEAVALLVTPVAGDMTYALFRQALAATLNVLGGNEAACVADAIDAANEWLVEHPVGSGVKAKNPAWTSEGAALAETLERYNDGELCAPSAE